MSVMETRGKIRRFERRVDQGDPRDENNTQFDILYVDRLTGYEIFRYDGADPANTNPEYGAISDAERFTRRGLDINAEIEISQSVVHVERGEIDRLLRIKMQKQLREKEEEEARDLLEFLGDAASNFNFQNYQYGENNILKVLLEARGFTDVAFYMVERDSFGPLIRGCVCYENGKRVRFFYG